MFIKGEDSINAKMVYQGKTGAIRKTQFSIIKFSEKGFCICGDVSTDRKNNYSCSLKLGHEFNSGFMTASHFQECVSFIEDIIRRVK